VATDAGGLYGGFGHAQQLLTYLVLRCAQKCTPMNE
jgi:hypothetical protein